MPEHGWRPYVLLSSVTQLQPPPSLTPTLVQIGGSIAGLMQGIMLKRQGHNVQILEQSTSSERLEGGIGIALGPDALEFFRRYDLMRQSSYISNPSVQFLNSLSEVMRFIKRPMEMSTWNRLYYNLRANFDGIKVAFSQTRQIRLKSTDGRVTVQSEDLLDGGRYYLQADLAIVSDGASSQIRLLLIPDVQRQYAGYLAYVDESEVSEETRKILGPNFTSYICIKAVAYSGTYIIPGKDGSLQPGDRRINWVWYDDCELDSPTFSEVLTSKTGHIHRNYVPVWQIRPSSWELQVEKASTSLIPPMLELVKKTINPAISVVHDFACPWATFFDGKVVLVGDALALFRLKHYNAVP
ncbi:hypothetical protein OIDMADRAFT_119509 [Oidiodendron maius Zn]|uniref:2,6-dihydroxypyridine 3-monooxygenase substrate binding domain-containing protein n=1 Tax=Oidiodendron maius (strain Zn) TaxID=913774 RepID=A0A0C3HK24_OIDMZ|nr:hypothetical protein OIDMADRAFT_119509 [Oidiodendron maius Zn]